MVNAYEEEEKASEGGVSEEEEKASEGGVSVDGGERQPYQYPASRSPRSDAGSESSHIGSLHIASGDCAEDDVNVAWKDSKAHKHRVFALFGLIFVLAVVLAVSVAMLFEVRKEASQQQYATLQIVGLDEGRPPQVDEGQQELLINEETPGAIQGEEGNTPEEEGGVVSKEETPAEQGIVSTVDVASEGPSASPTSNPTSGPTSEPTHAPTTAPTRAPTTMAPTGAPAKSPTVAPLDAAADEDGEGDMYLAAWNLESYDEPGRDELGEMGCWDSLGTIACCVTGLFC